MLVRKIFIKYIFLLFFLAKLSKLRKPFSFKKKIAQETKLSIYEQGALLNKEVEALIYMYKTTPILKKKTVNISINEYFG